MRIHPPFNNQMMSTRNARTRDALFQGIDGSTTSHPDPHVMHSGLMAEDSSMIQRWNSTWDATAVILQHFGRPLWPGQKSEPRQEEPDYDLPTESIPPSPHQCEGQHHHPLKKRERSSRSKKPITFMFHATYGDLLISIMENGLKSGKSQSNTSTWHASTTLSSTTTRQKQH